MKKPIPPRSVVVLKKLWPHARKQGHEVGDKRRIGYYSRQDGLDCVWLVDDAGDYGWASDHKWLFAHFEVLKLSDETDLYGVHRRRLRALSSAKKKRPNKTSEPTAMTRPPAATILAPLAHL
jgi:hypothetical protein